MPSWGRFCCNGLRDEGKAVDYTDIDAALGKIIGAPHRIDNYLFITTDVIDPRVAEYAAGFYEQTDGVEIAILDCIGFLRHFLHLFHRIRADYLNAYQELVLSEPDSAVSQTLKEAFLALRQAAESERVMDDRVQDYLFDLQGYLVLKNALSAADLREMNQWIDDHESYVQEPWSTDGDPKKKGRWIGHIETHTYNEENGVNFQSIIEGGPVFERLIDHPAWIDLVKKYIHSSVNGLSIHENFLNVRGPGGYLHIHCGGHVPLELFNISPEQHWRMAGRTD